MKCELERVERMYGSVAEYNRSNEEHSTDERHDGDDFSEYEEAVMPNHQIMIADSDGQYTPDYQRLIENAFFDPEQVEYIQSVEARGMRFAYNMVYITKLTCGHYEIFQAPMNEHYPRENNLKKAKEHAQTHKCTRCICNW